jgi:hypothetical protein
MVQDFSAIKDKSRLLHLFIDALEIKISVKSFDKAKHNTSW